MAQCAKLPRAQPFSTHRPNSRHTIRVVRAADARPAGVNRPELLPSQPTPVIDVAGFLTPSEEKRIASEVESLERDTGFKLRVLAQNYPETPGLAIREFWGVDDSSIVFVADPTFGDILNFNVGQAVDLEVPRHRKCPAPVPSPTVIQQLPLPSPVIDDDVQQPLQPVRVFVGVLSRSNNTIVRQAIRETWGSDKRLSFVKFMVLRPKSKRAFRALREEAVKHEDIIVVSAKVENYFNITYSTLELFRSAAVLGSQITHVLKTDEDCFLRVDPLLEALRKAPQHWMYGGHPLGYTDTVSRNPRDPNRIYVPYSNWPSDAPLPVYAWGHGGVLTMDLVKHIAAGAAHLAMDAENLLVLEDASTGVWVKYIADEQHQKINYVHLPFDRTVCRTTDALTHLEKWLWASLADSH
eukprot:gene3185-3463_t